MRRASSHAEAAEFRHLSNELIELAKKHRVDKWGSHWYAQHYHPHFAPFRQQKINLLEIGVGGYGNPAAGGQSLRMWEEYFPHATVYGIDVYDKQAHERGRVKIRQGSQDDEEFLKAVADEAGGFDIVIDDGSHENAHVIKSFSVLFPILKIGGIYAVEDVQTSYWPSFGGDSRDLRSRHTIMGFFKDLTDSLNYEEFMIPDYQPSYFDSHIVAMHFYHNLIIIKKGFNNEGSNILVGGRVAERPKPPLAAVVEDVAEGASVPERYADLGDALLRQGKPEEAEAAYRRALVVDPDRADLHNGCGNALKDQGRFDDALACYRRAIALDPAHCWGHFNLGYILQEQGDWAQARRHYDRVLEISPEHALAFNNIAQIVKSQGRTSEAVGYYRRAAELAPEARYIYSNLLFCLQYDPAMTAGALLLEHRAFGASLPAPPPCAFANSRDPEKRLKIGYVSPDLHQHPVGFLIMPVLAAHDRANFAVCCYYGGRRDDAVTGFLKDRAEIWRSTERLDDLAMADMIAADGIDVLIDLAGHTARNRLPVFARKPAPVQATWAGYEGTTGLGAMDYLITDRWLSPPGSERYAVEKLFRLPDGYVCWAVPSHAPEINPLPATAPGAVTFGCFNNLAKINPPVVALWARLLRKLPESRLLLKTRELADEEACAGLRRLFEVEGIRGDRLLFEGRSPHPEYLKRYRDLDIALDPFPFSGGVTTIDALWMGVPVVTLGGERFAARHTLSHLNVAGLGELVAEGPEDYLRIAAELARDLTRLSALRRGMRDRLRASALLRSRRFTRNLEQAYRTMWREWCMKTGQQPGGR